MVGGLIIRDLSWAWIFWINVPIGLASAAGFIAFLHEKERHVRPSLDIVGATLFTIAIGSLMMALTDAGTSNDTRALLTFGLFFVCSVLFAAQERRAADPMISFALWSHRPIAAANAATVFAGMALMGLTTFLPMYVQGVLHQSPVVAGLALTMMMVGWPVGATLAARSFHRFGLRRILVGGSVFLPVGAVVFVLLTPGSSPNLAAIGSLIMGFGMGVASVSSLVLIQELVDPLQRGSATASNLFSRNLGSTLGATMFGAVLNYGLTHSKGIGVVTSDQLRQVLEAPASNVGSDAAIRLALQQSLHLTFSAMLVISLAIVFSAMLIPAVALGKMRDATAS
jgi:MFS family permease